ncbi:caspase family protein [Undibacterium amnicola]|uniref:Caspase family protein n=1 Tax=Undibacterium amnicola TaxID=1834038 RepID=A0ABR6XUQ8_9BURK|nr:caspase family protein [Undibacterium amnicola]MBC3833205.1 caspase family protein [Undibacterium amnicola]
MHRFAFFLSSENYKHYSDTPYCHADAELLRKTLIESCDYLPENSIILKLEKDDGNTNEQILKQVADLVTQTKDGDSILFFYAGHGIAIDSNTYLVLPETSPLNAAATSLKLSEVNYYLSQNKRLNIRIFDCCHSGEGSRNAVSENQAAEFMQAILNEGNDCSLTFASCAVHEKSYPDDAECQGVFTASLVNAINAQKADSDIYLESLKIEVCNSVQAWCAKRGKTQTPTLRVQVTGNMPFARRKNPPEPEATLSTSPVLSRSEQLNNARQSVVVDNKLYPELTAALNIIATEFEKRIQETDVYGININRIEPKIAEDIPEFLKQKIIDRMKTYRTMHAMNVVRVERPQIKNSILSSFLEHRPIYDTNYYINQKFEMPKCFQTFESTTDGYIPSSSIFFYVCPLQTTIAVLMGYFFDKSFNASEPDIKLQKVLHKVYSISDFRNKEYVLGFDDFIASFKLDLELAIDERLTYLAKENQAASKPQA